MKIDFHKTNRLSFSTRLAACVAAGLLIGAGIVAETHKGTATSAKTSNHPSSLTAASKLNKSETAKAVDKLPLAFEPNRGQTDPRVKYLARAQGYMALLGDNEVVLRIKGATPAPLIMNLQNAKVASRVVASDAQAGKSNYLIGQDRSKWLTNVPNYGKVTYEDVYKGVDLAYSGNQRQLEYDFVVKPGADPSQIHVAYWGSTRFALNAKGDLEMETAAGPTTAQKPVVFQMIHGQRKQVEGAYVLTAKNEVGFKLGAYDRNETLVIDPTMTVLTAIGGGGPDVANGVSANSTGVYITGSTSSAASALTYSGGTGFPLTPGTCTVGGTSTATGCALESPVLGVFAPPVLPTKGGYNGAANSGGQDAFVMKLSADGTQLLYSTFLGGSSTDSGNAIAVDSTGAAYVTGGTSSTNFPVTNGSALSGTENVFVTKIAATGQSLTYSIYFGGSATDIGTAIAVDSSDNAYVGGSSTSTNIGMVFPLTSTMNTTPANFNGATNAGGTDGIIIKLGSGGGVEFSTFLGTSGNESVTSIATDGTNIYVAGNTSKGNTLFPVTSHGIVASADGTTNGFVVKIVPSASANASFSWSDTIGAGGETINALALDSSGGTYAAGENTAAFSLTAAQLGAPTGGVQTGTVNGTAITTTGDQGYILGLASGGKTANYITYLSNNSVTSGDILVPEAIALDDAGQGYIAATDTTTGDPFIWVVRLNPVGPINMLPTPGAANFSGFITGTDSSSTATADVATGIAVLPGNGSASQTLRTAFVVGGATPTSMHTIATVSAQAELGAFASTAAATALLRSASSSTLSPSTTHFPPANAGTEAMVFAAMTFQDLATTTPTVTFTTSPGGPTPSDQTVTITGVGSTSAPCPLTISSSSGPLTFQSMTYTPGSSPQNNASFFSSYSLNSTTFGPGTVKPVAGTTNQFVVSAAPLGSLTSAGIGFSGSFTVTGAGGCPFLEPLTVGVVYSAGSSYTTSSTGLTLSTPVGSTSGLPTGMMGSPFPTISVASGAGTLSTLITVNSPTQMGWQSCTPFTIAGSQPFSITPSPTSFTLTPQSCIGTAQTTPGTYTGTITVASSSPGVAATATIPYTITITPALTASPTSLSFTFGAGATGSSQSSVTLSGNGSSFAYTTSVSNGTFPAGALSVAGGASGTAPQMPGSSLVTIQVNPTGLASGAYSGKVTITSGSQMIPITVTANVGDALVPTFEATGASMFSPVPASGLSFNLPTALSATAVGTLNINGVGSSSTNVSSPTITYTTGSGWLINSPSGCNGNITNTTPVCSNALSINTTGLAAGSYSASIGFSSTTMGVASITIPVTLTVTTGPTFQQGTGSPLTFSPTATALSFAGAAGVTVTPQTLNLNVNAGTVSSATLTPSTNRGGSWLLICSGSECTPTSSMALSSQSLSTATSAYTVGVNTTNLTPGQTYTGSITVSATGSGSLVVPVSLFIMPAHPSGAGIFRSSNGLWLLDTNFNNVYDQGIDFTTDFSGNGLTPQPTDIAVAGDWNGDGTTKIGLYRPSTGTWFLDFNGNGVFDGPTIDRQYQYGGIAGDIPVVGDWNGTGVTKIGLFRGGFEWLLNLSGNGVFSGGTNDAVFAFGGLTGCTSGLPGIYSSEPAGACDIPVVGDWNKTGTTKVGVVRAAPGTSQPFLWILDTTGAEAFSSSSTVFAFGGIPGDVPIVGDWNNTGNTNIGVVREGFLWIESPANMPAAPGATLGAVFPFGGVAGDQPVVGRWGY